MYQSCAVVPFLTCLPLATISETRSEVTLHQYADVNSQKKKKEKEKKKLQFWPSFCCCGGEHATEVEEGSFGVGCGSWDASVKGLLTTFAAVWNKKIHRPSPTFQHFIQSSFATGRPGGPNPPPQKKKTTVGLKTIGRGVRRSATGSNYRVYRADYDCTCSVVTTGLTIRRNSKKS